MCASPARPPTEATGGPLPTDNAGVGGLASPRVPGSAAPRPHYQAIVIGSGFGGAVTACRLGEAGIDTLVLERGQEWVTNSREAVFGSEFRYGRNMFWFRETASWLAVDPFPMQPYAGVLEVSDQRNLAIACGAALGGGSVVYTCSTIAPSRVHFERIFPASVSYEDMARRWYPKARAALRPDVVPTDLYTASCFAHCRAWDRHVTAAGYSPQRLTSAFNWDVIGDELTGAVRASASIGESVFGCSNGAKNSLTATYLPRAVASGHVELRTLSEVQGIGRAVDRYQVLTHHIDADGHGVEAVEYTCDMLFLCAGTLNSNRLLVAARETGALSGLDDTIGTGFGNNGDQLLGYTHEDEGLPWLASPSASTLLIEDEFDLPIRVESWELMGLQPREARPTVVSLVMTADPEQRGTFTYDEFAKEVTLSDWTDQDAVATAAATAWTERVMNANPRTAPLRTSLPPLTAHPLGGCVLGTSCDPYGRVNGQPGLYISDGSMIPGNCGAANPSFTITALAERNIAHIIAHSG